MQMQFEISRIARSEAHAKGIAGGSPAFCVLAANLMRPHILCCREVSLSTLW